MDTDVGLVPKIHLKWNKLDHQRLFQKGSIPRVVDRIRKTGKNQA